jgi:hypothetical protein
MYSSQNVTRIFVHKLVDCCLTSKSSILIAGWGRCQYQPRSRTAPNRRWPSITQLGRQQVLYVRSTLDAVMSPLVRSPVDSAPVTGLRVALL